MSKHQRQPGIGMPLYLKAGLPVLILSIFPALFISAAPIEESGNITRGEFVKMIAKDQPDNPLLPGGHSSLGPAELYEKTSQALSRKGFRVLENKNPDEAMTQQEFIRVAYAFTGGPAGKNLYEQKLMLKETGIISSPDVGLATGIEGQVLQRHEGQGSGSPAEVASPIFMKDLIKTESNAKADFTFDDGTTLTLGEDAAVNITKHIYDPDKDLRQTIVQVAQGSVRFVVTKGKANGSLFKVVTPTATAGVRGTEFVVTVEPNGRTSFVGIEGVIETTPLLPNGKEGRKMTVTKNMVQTVDETGNTDGPRTAPGDLIKRIQEKTTTARTLTNKGITKSRASDVARSKWLAKASVNNIQKNGFGGPDRTFAGNPARPIKSSLKPGNKGFAKTAAVQAAKNAAKGAAKTAASQAAKDVAKTAAQTVARGGGNPNPGGGNPNPGGGNPNPGGGNPNPGGGNPNPGGGNPNPGGGNPNPGGGNPNPGGGNPNPGGGNPHNP